jgi:5-methylcytosine-specific restriction endonuclease McrA
MISWQDYVHLFTLGKVTIIEATDGEYWRSPSTKVPKALVVQVHHYVKLKHGPKQNAVKKILYARDNGQCGYCAVELTLREATREHIVPKSRGKELGMSPKQINGWENQMICCVSCNGTKGNKLPWEAKMYPLFTPKKPDYVSTLIRGAHHPIQQNYIEQSFTLNTETGNVTEHGADANG